MPESPNNFSSYNYEIQTPEPPPVGPRNDAWTLFKHALLFVLTFMSVSVTSLTFVGQSGVAESFWSMLDEGALFAFLLLAFLGTHEFGHYFAAVNHRIKTTLPYFIPIPFIAIGTLGAVIRIKEKIEDTRKLFDVGISGPIAGFIVSLIVLIYGFSTLPEPDFINNFAGHEHAKEYVAQHGTYPESPVQPEGEGQLIVLGETLLYSFIASFFDNVPPMWEMYHFPFLFAGWLGLFFTALNLTPIGQLDGGHILYSLIGYKNHQLVARIFYGVLTMLAGAGIIPPLYQLFSDWGALYGSMAWLAWAPALYYLLNRAYHGIQRWVAPTWFLSLIGSTILIFGFVGLSGNNGFQVWLVWSIFIAFFVGVEHPPAMFERRLDKRRLYLGWLSMALFVLCISPNPIYILS